MVWTQRQKGRGRRKISFRGLKQREREKGGLRIEVSHVPLLSMPFGSIQGIGLVPSQDGIDKLNPIKSA